MYVSAGAASTVKKLQKQSKVLTEMLDELLGLRVSLASSWLRMETAAPSRVPFCLVCHSGAVCQSPLLNSFYLSVLRPHD